MGTEWKELKSKKGASYEVGRESSTGSGTGQFEVPTTGNDFGVTVNWAVGDDGKTSDKVKKLTGITAYSITNSRKSGYQYDLQIETIWTGDETYFFHDETGDSYKCDSSEPNNYTVSYNSTKPTILYISGSQT